MSNSMWLAIFRRNYEITSLPGPKEYNYSRNPYERFFLYVFFQTRSLNDLGKHGVIKNYMAKIKE